MKLYKFKPHKEPDDSSDKDKVTPKPKPKPKPKAPPIKTLATSTATTRKLAVTRHLAYLHPTSTLKVGTLSANIKRVVPIEGDIQRDVIHCLRDAVSQAARTKRAGQRAIGRFVEHVNKNGPGPDDRQFLDLLCPR
ncbi:hypothetical protein BGZ80_009051, partial [Entomortierella chlamydospora]